MNLYIVRHGETILNREKRHQQPEAPLSETGIKQAKCLTQRVKNLDITRICASPFNRTKETSEIINEELMVKVFYFPEIQDVRKPKEIRGRKHSDPEVMKIKTLLKTHYHDENWRFSDEEKFSELKDRVEKFLKTVERQPTAENILVVTHNVVAIMMIAQILLGGTLSSFSFLNFYDHLESSNVGLTHCRLNEDKKWKLISWNDLFRLNF